MAHYVAQLRIEKVEYNENKDRGSANHGSKTREVSKVTQMTIKAESLEKLTTKLIQHAQLIGD